MGKSIAVVWMACTLAGWAGVPNPWPERKGERAVETEKIRAEWLKMREELRKQGYSVAARVETPAEVAADMERVRRDMERRAGKPAVSDMQRIGGGGAAPAGKPESGGVSVKPLEFTKTLRKK